MQLTYQRSAGGWHVKPIVEAGKIALYAIIKRHPQLNNRGWWEIFISSDRYEVTRSDYCGERQTLKEAKEAADGIIERLQTGVAA